MSLIVVPVEKDSTVLDLLTQEEMFQDIMADYAQKTVTYEKHERIGSH